MSRQNKSQSNFTYTNKFTPFFKHLKIKQFQTLVFELCGLNSQLFFFSFFFYNIANTVIESRGVNLVAIRKDNNKGYVCFNTNSAVTVLVRIFNVFVELTKKPQRILEFQILQNLPNFLFYRKSERIFLTMYKDISLKQVHFVKKNYGSEYTFGNLFMSRNSTNISIFQRRQDNFSGIKEVSSNESDKLS